LLKFEKKNSVAKGLKADDACTSFAAVEVNQKNILVQKFCGDKYNFCQD
jgi:hypothetical protein